MSYKNPLISVVIPTYNRGHIINRTVKSVLRQTYSNFELIIVDDASTDNTDEIIKEYQDERIKYIKLQENTMGRRPRNLGINLSNGEFIAFLDSDDEWLPKKLESQLKYIIKSGLPMDSVMCFTGLIMKNGKSETVKKNKSFKTDMDIMDYILVGNNKVQTSTYMISSTLAKRTLFDSNLRKHQDWDFCIRLRNNQATFLEMPDHLTIWYLDEDNTRLSKSYNKEDVSLDWLNSKKNDISTQAQLAFKAIILVDNLVAKNQKIEAFKVIIIAYINKTINIKQFIKALVKIILPPSIQTKLRSVFAGKV